MTVELGLARATCNVCGGKEVFDAKDTFGADNFACPPGWSHMGSVDQGHSLQYKRHICPACIEAINSNVRRKMPTIAIRIELEKKGGEDERPA